MKAGRVLLGVLALTAVGVFAWWAWPKSCLLNIAPHYVGHYRGLGLPARDGFFGRSYLRVTVTDEHGRTEVQYARPGYNRFEGYYKGGTVREEGECLVELINSPEYPCPDLHDVREGTFYRPDGTLASEIRDGSGTQTYWTTGGVKIWELELRRSKRVRLSIWHPNGQLMTAKTYAGGALDGPFVSYYPSGAKKVEGAYSRDERSGTWTRYDEGGGVAGVEEYRASRRPSPGPE